MIAAVVLAAGLSRRMGRPKLFLEIGGRPLLRWSVEGVLRHVDETLVVTGPDVADARAALSGLPVRFCTNPTPERGQGSSIATGVAALGADTEAALVVLGDQPTLDEGIVPALIATFRRTGTPIVTPVYRGTPGVPVLFGAAVFDELRVLTGDAGARSVVQRDPGRVERLPLDIDMPADVDTPEEYERLRGSGHAAT